MSYTPKLQNNTEQDRVSQHQPTSSMIQDNRDATLKNIQLQRLMSNGKSLQQNIQLKQRMTKHQQFPLPHTALQNTDTAPSSSAAFIYSTYTNAYPLGLYS